MELINRFQLKIAYLCGPSERKNFPSIDLCRIQNQRTRREKKYNINNGKRNVELIHISFCSSFAHEYIECEINTEAAELNHVHWFAKWPT